MADFVKITLMYRNQKQGSYIDHVCNVDLIDLLDGATVGDDWYKIKVVNMTDDVFNKLPEFTGF